MPVQPDPGGSVTVNPGCQRPSGGHLDPALDRATLIARFAGDLAFFSEVAAVFLEDYPRLLGQLREARARQDLPALRMTAHAFKGAISHFTNGDAYTAAAALERAAEAGRQDAFSESCRVEEVIATFAAALAAARAAAETS